MSDGGCTLPSVRRDFAEWHRGRTPYVLWGLDLDTPAVRRRVAAAAERLAGWLLPGYSRQPHLTLALRGFPAGAVAPAADEHGAACLAGDIERLRAAAPPPFELALGELASFAAAPYLAAQGAGLGALRDCLEAGRPAYPGFVHVPHVTVGLYAGCWPLAAVAERAAAWREAPLLCPVGQVALFAYDPREIGGSLWKLGEFCLHDRLFRSR